MNRLYWRYAFSTRPCRGCSDPSPHDAHLTLIAKILLRLSYKGRALMRFVAERDQ